MSERLVLIGLLFALGFVVGCKSRTTPKVIDVKRADYVAEDVAEKVNVRRPDPGMVFLRVTLDAGADLGQKDTLTEFLDLLKLTDESGKEWSFGGPGFIYDRQKNANQIELFWSVPKEKLEFVLDFGGDRIDVSAPQALNVYLPDLAPIPNIPPPDIGDPRVVEGPPVRVERGVIGGPIGGPSDGPVAIDDAPPPPKPAPTPRRTAPISGGVLNGRAISLPKPAYPAIAKAARATGIVTVQVTIDESGRVISANALSGHPLLRQAAVQSAYQAKFAPTMLSGEPVKVSGVITYNFVAQ